MLQAALRERYALLPYLYTLFREANTTGVPIMRPLWYDFPAQAALFEEEHAFMLGPAILAAPVLDEGATALEVPLPAGEVWYDGHTGARIAPDAARLQVAVDADSIPWCAPCVCALRCPK